MNCLKVFLKSFNLFIDSPTDHHHPHVIVNDDDFNDQIITALSICPQCPGIFEMANCLWQHSKLFMTKCMTVLLLILQKVAKLMANLILEKNTPTIVRNIPRSVQKDFFLYLFLHLFCVVTNVFISPFGNTNGRSIFGGDIDIVAASMAIQ